MAELKIKISDELAVYLHPYKERLEKILEAGLQENEMKNNLLFEEVVDFLATDPTLEELIALRPSPTAQERIRELLDKNREGILSETESAELDDYQKLNHIMTLIKANARRNLEKR